MPFLSIAGITLQFVSFKRRDVYLGEEVRAFDNSLLSSRRGAKAEYTGVTKPYTLAEVASVLTAIANGAKVPVTGDALNGVSITARVSAEEADYERARRRSTDNAANPQGFEVSYHFAIRQV